MNIEVSDVSESARAAIKAKGGTVKVRRPYMKTSILISHNAFLKSFCRSQLPHTSVILSFAITTIKIQLTDLCRNWLLRNDLENTLCEINMYTGVELTLLPRRLDCSARCLRSDVENVSNMPTRECSMDPFTCGVLRFDAVTGVSVAIPFAALC